jgi:signal peptidase II
MLEQGKMAGVASPAAEQQASVAKWFVLAVAIIVLDQLTKVYFNGSYQYGEQREVIPAVLNFTLLYNPGAAFSFLADAGGWQKFFFTGLAFAVSGWLGWQIVQRKFSTLMNWAAAFIIGGALGNVIDRLIHGHVIDFIQVHWQQSWYYPAFNIADSFICVGAALMVLDSFRQPRS